MALPKIPSEIPSHLGPVAVTLDPDLMASEDCYGKTVYATREVVLQADMSPTTAWVTYWHEALHVFLFDSGLANNLKPELQETFCDSFGTWMTMAMQQGYFEFPVED